MAKVNRGRRNALSLAVLGTLAALSFLQFDWLTVSMAPDGKRVILGTLSGAQLFQTANALIVFATLAVILLFLVRGWAVRAFAAAALLAVAGSVIAVLPSLIASKFDTATGQLANWTNIAAAHDIDKLTLEASINSWLFIAACLISALGSVLAIMSAAQWTRVRNQRAASKDSIAIDSEPEDPISLWESQRGK